MGYASHLRGDLESLDFLDAIGQRFYFPRITPRFSSPMVRVENLWANYTASDRTILAWVGNGLKPTGYLNRLRCLTLAPEGLVLRVWAGWWPRSPAMVGITMQTDRVRDVFDLDALASDYSAYLADAPSAAVAEVHAAIRRLAPKRFTDLLDFGLVGYLKRPADYVRAGLLLGYPVGSTVAILRQDLLGLSGGTIDMPG